MHRITRNRFSIILVRILADYELRPGFAQNLALSENKKKDLKAFRDECKIPPYYRSFYDLSIGNIFL